MDTRPLADRIRPDSLELVVGQKHILDVGKPLYNILKTGSIPNMIFYGPSGTGKTTVANIAAKVSDKKLYKINATNASLADIKSIVGDLDSLLTMNGVLLYLDEIQNFNKKQQQSLLEFIENGKITLIASTTENPYFYIYNAILSRSVVFEFKPIESKDIEAALDNAVKLLKSDGLTIKMGKLAKEHIANMAYGDARKALNGLELAIMTTPKNEKGIIDITIEVAEECTQKKAFRHDKSGDSHYDVLSAFQKSIRGSDPDAALHYLARLVVAGDLVSICRRLLVIAAEDIGLAYPTALSVTQSAVAAAQQLGFPEARIPLAEAVILLATAPKSNSAVCAINAAISDIETKDTGDVPQHLKDSHYAGAKKLGRGTEYLYPHSFENSYVKQQYLPDNIRNRQYYEAGANKFEQNFKDYWDKIKKK